MGLVVPDGYSGFLRAGNTSRAWAYGDAFVFDDSFEHEVLALHPARLPCAAPSRGGGIAALCYTMLYCASLAHMDGTRAHGCMRACV